MADQAVDQGYYLRIRSEPSDTSSAPPGKVPTILTQPSQHPTGIPSPIKKGPRPRLSLPSRVTTDTSTPTKRKRPEVPTSAPPKQHSTSTLDRSSASGNRGGRTSKKVPKADSKQPPAAAAASSTSSSNGARNFGVILRPVVPVVIANLVLNNPIGTLTPSWMSQNSMVYAGVVHVPCYLAVSRGPQLQFGMMYYDQFLYESIESIGFERWNQDDLYFGMTERVMHVARACGWKAIIFHLNEPNAISRSVAGRHQNATPRATRIFGRLSEFNHQNPIHVLFSQANQNVPNLAEEMIRRNHGVPKSVGWAETMESLEPALQVNRGLTRSEGNMRVPDAPTSTTSNRGRGFIPAAPAPPSNAGASGLGTAQGAEVPVKTWGRRRQSSNAEGATA